MSASIDYVTISNLIIDDIVLPDGRTFMNTLGGAGTHALVGMRIWNAKLGYCASAGHDLADEHRLAMLDFGVDLAGLVSRDRLPQARAWQLFEPDERRIEIFRTDLTEFSRNRVKMEEIPASYRQARGFHLQWGTLLELSELIRALVASNPAVALALEPNVELFKEAGGMYREILPYLALFSPDLGEAEQITGYNEPDAIFETLFSWGAQLVALRMGASGSVVCERTGAGWMIPAVPTTIVDVTGAGNSYVGGFLTGLGDGLSAPESALRAAVSASFALEQFGLPSWSIPPQDEIERRMNWASQRVSAYG